MKIRALLFLLTFLLGAVTGYFAGQEKSKVEAKRLFTEASIRVEGWVHFALSKVTPVSAKARASDTAKATPPAPAVEDPQEKANYIRQFVEITDLQAKSEPASGRAPTISGKVHNKGGRSIRQLKITAYFIGPEGIVSEIQYPVVEQSALASNSNTEFRFRVENVPESWIKGKLRASVTELAFAN